MERHLRPRSQLFVTTAGLRGPEALNRACALVASPVIEEFCDGVVVAQDTIERIGLPGCREVFRANERLRERFGYLVEQHGPRTPAEHDLVLDLLHEMRYGLRPRAFLLTQQPHLGFKAHDFAAAIEERLGGAWPYVYMRSQVPDHFIRFADDPDKVLVATGIWCDDADFRPPEGDIFSEKINKVIHDRGAGSCLIIVLHHRLFDGLSEERKIAVLRECRRQVNDLNRRYANDIQLDRTY